MSGVAGVVVAILAKRDAGQSARAASRSADEAVAVTRLGLDKRHEELQPEAPGEIVAEARDGALFGTIIVRRDYRFRAVAVLNERATQDVAAPLLIRANQPLSFQIENWPAGAETPKTREIRFRFWPSIAGADLSARPSFGQRSARRRMHLGPVTVTSFAFARLGALSGAQPLARV